MSSAKPFLVTTPIYYVNGSPHIGHLFTTLVVTVLADYHRLWGGKAFCSTGTDEHGQKVQQTAEAQRIHPQTLVDNISADFKSCFESLGLSTDFFIRTTQREHIATVESFWSRMVASGDIYLGMYEGWYSVSDEAFVPAAHALDAVDTDGNPCKISEETGKPLTWVSEENYKFKLSAYQQKLLEWLDSEPSPIEPEARRREVRAFVASGLHDLSVSRKADVCSWGIPVPNAAKHTIYVWLDALSNYYTVSQCGIQGTNMWPADVHVLGKDILKFHAVYWPAFLISLGLPLPRKLLVHSWWTMDTDKISKSGANTVSPLELSQRFGKDALCYFMLREAAWDSDSEFTVEGIQARLNSELADLLGNLLLRAVSRKLHVTPSWPTAPMNSELQEQDQLLMQHIRALPSKVHEAIIGLNIRKALQLIVDVLRETNQYATRNAPWKLVKADPEHRLPPVLFMLLESIRFCITLLSPVLTENSPRMFDILGVPSGLRSGGMQCFEWGAVPEATPFGNDTGVVFPKYRRHKKHITNVGII